ncbi:MAG: hypothetical protein ACRD5H_03770, partial [Nitrososphaerales archaeon]
MASISTWPPNKFGQLRQPHRSSDSDHSFGSTYLRKNQSGTLPVENLRDSTNELDLDNKYLS